MPPRPVPCAASSAPTAGLAKKKKWQPRPLQALRVCVTRGLGGAPACEGADSQLLLDDVDPESTVACLKERLCSLCGLPPAVQELVFDNVVLRNEERLGTRCPSGGPPMQVVLVVVLDRLLKELEHPTATTRLRALQDLAQFGAAGPAAGATSVCAAAAAARLEDEVHLVRLAAADALGKVAPPGDETAIAEAAARLENPDRGVRQAAIKALCHVAPPGNRRALEAAAALQGNPDPGVRLAAIKALRKLAAEADAFVVATLVGCAEDPDPDVRLAALWGLQEVAPRGDAAACAAATARIEDADPQVRAAAAMVLGQVADRADEQASAQPADGDGG